MLLIFFAAIVFAFLALGSVVFVICVLVPRLRPYALSSALWCAVWGPCSVALMTLAGLGLVGVAFINKAGYMETVHAPKLLAAFGWGYLVIGALITTAIATGVSWLHQKLVRRFTFALFRLYVTAVCAGIGSVFGWVLSWWLIWKEIAHFTLLFSCIGMLVLITAFAMGVYKGARALRGKAPTNFTWISPEEFAGTDRS